MKCNSALAIAAILFLSLPAAASSQPDTDRLTVCTRMDGQDFNKSILVPSAMFRRIGIRIEWHSLSGCPAGSVRMRLIAAAPSNLPAGILGRAYPLDGHSAEVFLDRVNSAAGPDRGKRAALLGYVLAHELIHLLEGGGTEHADVGIMRARWSVGDVETMKWGLDLTTGDVDLIREGLSARPSTGSLSQHVH